MRIDEYPTEPRYTAKVLSTECVSGDGADTQVWELVLEIDDHEFNFSIGQSIGVLVEGPEDFGGSVHHRLYTVADIPKSTTPGKPEVTIAVKRCNYIDAYNGEEYEGINSNYLCDRKPGDQFSITGPFGIPFEIPDDKNANLLLIGLGTGIAPFRAFIRHIYEAESSWQGKVRLLYGAQSGLELVYMNEKRDDFAQYYDEETFEAIKALSPRPNWADPIAWDYAIEERAEEIWNMLSDEHTYVYVAGLRPIRDVLDKLFSDLAGSSAKWEKIRNDLVEQKRWVELLY